MELAVVAITRLNRGSFGLKNSQEAVFFINYFISAVLPQTC